MKRYFIILVVLIVLCAMPVLAKPMVAVTNPLVDDGFMLDELNDEQLTKIEGNRITDMEGNIPEIIFSIGSAGFKPDLNNPGTNMSVTLHDNGYIYEYGPDGLWHLFFSTDPYAPKTLTNDQLYKIIYSSPFSLT